MGSTHVNTKGWKETSPGSQQKATTEKQISSISPHNVHRNLIQPYAKCTVTARQRQGTLGVRCL